MPYILFIEDRVSIEALDKTKVLCTVGVQCKSWNNESGGANLLGGTGWEGVVTYCACLLIF
jgi:hypothetical protein